MTENKLNRLERSIQSAEDSAEDARWMQAEEVVRRLDRGETAREIAASWTNLRTGNPYAHSHVTKCSKVWRTYGLVPVQDRPEWHKVYDQNPTTRSERMQSQPPTTVETALKLVDNVMKSAPAEVQDTLYHELKLARAGEDRSPAARKAATAAASAAVAPIRRAVATSQAALTIHAQHEVTQGIRELLRDDAVTPAWLKDMDKAINQSLELLAEARFGLGVEA